MNRDATSPLPAAWTVLVYMSANNNLAGAADACLAAMESVAGNGAVNVVVEVRRPGLPSHGPTTTRYCVRGAATETIPVEPSPSMGRPGTLTDFIDWGLGACPARRSLLVVWGHGTGLEDLARRPSIAPSSGVESRDPEGSDSLTNQALREAIAGSAARRVDVLGCDACLMSMVEIAYEMRGVADFLVASETEQPSQSWPYASLLAALVEQPAMSPADLAKTLVESFLTWYRDPKNPNDLGYATQTAVDLRSTPHLVGAIDALAAALVPRLPLIDQVRDELVAMEIPDYVDLGDLLDLLDQTGSEQEVVSATQRVREALAAARLDSGKLGPETTGITGLSIYFPTLENAALFPGYHDLAFAAATRWPALLRAYAASAVGNRAA